MSKDSYNLAALRGMGDESYNSAALRGFGDESYNSAALRGMGDESYNSAALRGMGKFKKGSPEAKAFMARLRAMRKKKGGKKLKGGLAFSTVAAALGLIPTAIKGAHEIYKWIKESKGGRAVFLNNAARDKHIEDLKKSYKGRRLAALYPYTLVKASKYAAQREKRMGAAIAQYLKDNGLFEEAIKDIPSLKKYMKEARARLRSNLYRDEDGIVYPDGYSPPPPPPPLTMRRKPRTKAPPPLTMRRKPRTKTPPPLSMRRKPKAAKSEYYMNAPPPGDDVEF